MIRTPNYYKLVCGCKHLDQFHELCEDFNITKLPLLSEELHGVDSWRSFSPKNLTKLYVPEETTKREHRCGELEEEVVFFRNSVTSLHSVLEKLRERHEFPES